MEDAEIFESQLNQLIKDSKEKLGITDKTLAYILLREGLGYYLRTISQDMVEKKT